MKSLVLTFLFTLVLIMPASAKLYKWRDSEGVLHVVDDLHMVPQKDMDKLGIDLDALEEEIRAPEKSIIKPAPQIQDAPTKTTIQKKPIDPSDEMFDGKTLQWWVRTLNRIKREQSEIVRSMESKEEYIRIFEGGRKLGSIYNQNSVDRYTRYKRELPEDRETLKKKKDYLVKLIRRAKNAGVPRNVR